MAQKKSFKDNPALQFISTAAEETEEREQPVARATTEKAPEGYKPNPLYIETKSKRVQLVLQPSLYEKAKAKAQSGGYASFNDFVHQLLEEATREE